MSNPEKIINIIGNSNMTEIIKLKQLILLFGDIFLFYLALGLTLIIRYQNLPSASLWQKHFWSFSSVFFIWLIIFYIAELYNIRFLKNNFEFNKRWGVVLSINILFAMGIFYVFPPETGLAPKTNLLLLGLVFGTLGFIWRRIYNTTLRRGEPANKILIIDSSAATKEIIFHLQQNPQLGYELKAWLQNGFNDERFKQLSQIILQEDINVIVVPAHLKKNSAAAQKIYQNLIYGIEVMDIATLYSLIFQKTPLSELEEVWFLENITQHHQIYDSVKRPLETILALGLSLIFLLPAVVIGLLIKLTSKGPIFISQNRIGQNEHLFKLYKFRTMIANAPDGSAEGATGPRWAAANDPRRTALGRFLRATRLDEIPQLWNVLRGDMSFVGPRPERSEFVEQLKKAVPYYELRHLVRPGLTGWAQINYRYGASVADAYQKLQYDIYYLKNYSFWLDLSILIKTGRMFFVPVA